MGLLEEWDKVKKGEKDRASVKKWALTKGSPIDKKPYISSGGSARLPEDVIRATVERNTLKPGAGSASKRNILPPGWRERNAAMQAQQQQQSFMDQLLEGATQQYEPPPRPDMTEQINVFKAGLDQALAARLGALGGIRNNAQQSYNTSDQNLANMFSQNANDMATRGAQAYRDITSEHKANIGQSRDSSIQALQDDRARQVAERQAMLKNLGIEEAGRGPDIVADTLSQGVQGTTNRANINLNMADTLGASNQGFNQSMVNSINQQGAERRAALTQQLANIQNQLSMAEADATSQTEQAKANGVLEMQQSMASAPDNSYEVFRDRQNNLLDIYKMMIEQQGQSEEEPEPVQVRGFGGLAQDLINSQIAPEQAAQYMGALSNVLGSEYMQGIHPDEGYDRASIIARRLMEDYNVPAVIAGQLATNYANLGNNAYYTAQ